VKYIVVWGRERYQNDLLSRHPRIADSTKPQYNIMKVYKCNQPIAEHNVAAALFCLEFRVRASATRIALKQRPIMVPITIIALKDCSVFHYYLNRWRGRKNSDRIYR